MGTTASSPSFFLDPSDGLVAGEDDPHEIPTLVLGRTVEISTRAEKAPDEGRADVPNALGLTIEFRQRIPDEPLPGLRGQQGLEKASSIRSREAGDRPPLSAAPSGQTQEVCRENAALLGVLGFGPQAQARQLLGERMTLPVQDAFTEIHAMIVSKLGTERKTTRLTASSQDIVGARRFTEMTSRSSDGLRNLGRLTVLGMSLVIFFRLEFLRATTTSYILAAVPGIEEAAPVGGEAGEGAGVGRRRSAGADVGGIGSERPIIMEGMSILGMGALGIRVIIGA